MNHEEIIYTRVLTTKCHDNRLINRLHKPTNQRVLNHSHRASHTRKCCEEHVGDITRHCETHRHGEIGHHKGWDFCNIGRIRVKGAVVHREASSLGNDTYLSISVDTDATEAFNPGVTLEVCSCGSRELEAERNIRVVIERGEGVNEVVILGIGFEVEDEEKGIGGEELKLQRWRYIHLSIQHPSLGPATIDLKHFPGAIRHCVDGFIGKD